MCFPRELFITERSGTILRKNLVVLGSTGSIGTQTLDVARGLSARVSVVGLSAHARWESLFDQAQEFRPRWVAVTSENLTAVDRSRCPASCELLFGESGVERMVSDAETEMVLAAMVGSAGLRSTVCALEHGKDIALANKETLVVGGPVVMETARRKNCQILPVDSEHSAVFQALQAGRRADVERVVLTASGGPFRQRPLSSLQSVTVEEALRHPTWNMGPKITIDSATMMNKALEIIEAHWLFGLSADQIGVVIHPQSMIHSMVEYRDGSVIAQASPPDMRLPIQYALTYPDRLPSPAQRFDWKSLGDWTFQEPDFDRFPALRLGYEVVRTGGTSGAALNAANEVAVERFLAREIPYTDIVQICKDVLSRHPFEISPTLAELESVDRWARQEARCWTRSASLKRSSFSA